MEITKMKEMWKESLSQWHIIMDLGTQFRTTMVGQSAGSMALVNQRLKEYMT